MLTRGDELKKIIKESGVSITFISYKMNCSRNRIYAILDGADCTASEIAKLSEILHMSKNIRDYVFLSQNVN